jgi:hypothetical protein
MGQWDRYGGYSGYMKSEEEEEEEEEEDTGEVIPISESALFA